MFKVDGFSVGDGSLTIIGGPCLAESKDLCLEVASTLKPICDSFGFNYVFKASFDKANRTSANSVRGAGMADGLSIIEEVGSEVGVPTTTDIHLPEQAAPTAAVVDILQIPAFLCRQSDLLQAAAATGKPVNVKKGQFLAPHDTKNIVEKTESVRFSRNHAYRTWNHFRLQHVNRGHARARSNEIVRRSCLL